MSTSDDSLDAFSFFICGVILVIEHVSCCFQVSVCGVGLVFCWHDLDNSEYDCWPLDRPNEYNMIDCGGEKTDGSYNTIINRRS